MEEEEIEIAFRVKMKISHANAICFFSCLFLEKAAIFRVDHPLTLTKESQVSKESQDSLSSRFSYFFHH